MQQKCFLHISHFIVLHKILQKDMYMFQGQDLIQLIISTAPSRTFLSKTCMYVNMYVCILLQVYAGEEYNDYY